MSVDAPRRQDYCPARMASLMITSGSEGGRRVECDRELVIGRGDADVVVSDDQMSRRHAAVRPVAGGIEVEDLGSLNGTFVNGEQISGKVTLTENATVRIGVTEFALEVPPAEPEIPAGATRISAQPPLDATAVRQAPPVGGPPPGVGGPPPGVGGPPPGVGGPPGGGPPPWVQAGGGPPGGPPGGGPPPWVQAGGGPPGGGPPNLKGPLKLLAKTPIGKLIFKRKMKRAAKQQQAAEQSADQSP